MQLSVQERCLSAPGIVYRTHGLFIVCKKGLICYEGKSSFVGLHTIWERTSDVRLSQLGTPHVNEVYDDERDEEVEGD